MNDRLYYTDRPSDVDALGFTDYRPALVEVITRGETPLTMGIFGSWGTGKTSLLRMLWKDLWRKEAPPFPYRVVHRLEIRAHRGPVARLHPAGPGCPLSPRRGIGAAGGAETDPL